jgi:hypothetical protein
MKTVYLGIPARKDIPRGSFPSEMVTTVYERVS